jgi:hypothetical protein
MRGMRVTLLIIVLVVAGGFAAYKSIRRAPPRLSAAVAEPSATTPSASANSKVDFDQQIKPILQSRCQPCHFQGGKVYDRMPFDRPETIKTLGAKLFTRIKNEDQRRLIREFLAQP